MRLTIKLALVSGACSTTDVVALQSNARVLSKTRRFDSKQGRKMQSKVQLRLHLAFLAGVEPTTFRLGVACNCSNYLYSFHIMHISLDFAYRNGYFGRFYV